MPDNDAWKLITRGVLEIIEEEDLRKKLAKGTPLNIKLGVDPTAPDIHLGFTVVMRKLRQFQDLGHRVILIVGDYTATVGDPSGKNKTRPILTHEEVLKNAETYKQQFFKIVDESKTRVVYNGEWFSKLDFTGVTKLMSQITVAQMLEREDFQNRYRNHQPISLHEFLYPMMQAYDSVMIDADVELGGMDQKFNVLRGRELQRGLGKEPQVGLFMPILLGTDGKEKMSKSLGNYVGVNEAPQVMYHKLFTLPDSLIKNYFELLTDYPLELISAMLESIEKAQAVSDSHYSSLLSIPSFGLMIELSEGRIQVNQLKHNDVKMALALEIVSQYYGSEGARLAALEERRIFSAIRQGEKGIATADTKVWSFKAGEYTLPWLLRETGLATSASVGTNLVTSGTVFWDGEKITDPRKKVPLTTEHLLQQGNRKSAKVKPED